MKSGMHPVTRESCRLLSPAFISRISYEVPASFFLLEIGRNGSQTHYNGLDENRNTFHITYHLGAFE